MPHVAAARTADREGDAGRYQRHWPEQTLFYQIVDEYYPAFTALMAERGRELPNSGMRFAGGSGWPQLPRKTGGFSAGLVVT